MNTAPKHLKVAAGFKPASRWSAPCVFTLCMLAPMVWALEINQASEAELDSLRGMGPSLSAKVLAARSQGLFINWQDVMRRVSGLREAKAQRFSEQGLTVQGLPFNNATASTRQ